jgi:hypothetical protein
LAKGTPTPVNNEGKKSSAITDKNAVATITEMENDSVKADTAGDSSYVKKNYADNFIGGSSWGNWVCRRDLFTSIPSGCVAHWYAWECRKRTGTRRA